MPKINKNTMTDALHWVKTLHLESARGFAQRLLDTYYTQLTEAPGDEIEEIFCWNQITRPELCHHLQLVSYILSKFNILFAYKITDERYTTDEFCNIQKGDFEVLIMLDYDS